MRQNKVDKKVTQLHDFPTPSELGAWHQRQAFYLYHQVNVGFTHLPGNPFFYEAITALIKAFNFDDWHDFYAWHNIHYETCDLSKACNPNWYVILKALAAAHQDEITRFKASRDL